MLMLDFFLLRLLLLLLLLLLATIMIMNMVASFPSSRRFPQSVATVGRGPSWLLARELEPVWLK